MLFDTSCDHEPKWNEREHGQMLKQAVKHISSFQYHNISYAGHYACEALKKKMVNYAIVLDDLFISTSRVVTQLEPSAGKLKKLVHPIIRPFTTTPSPLALKQKCRTGQGKTG